MLHIEQGYEVTAGNNCVEVSGADEEQKWRIAALVLERTGNKKTRHGFAAFHWHNLSHGMVFRLSPESPISHDELVREVEAAAKLYLG